MTRTISLVQQVQIASPCTATWDDMAGDDRSRFCSHCTLNVYNLSAMSEAEGERLIIEKEGKLCARFYRRYDGTVLTKDCPVGLQAVRKRIVWLGMRAAAALAFIIVSASYAIGGRTSAIDSLDLPGIPTVGTPTLFERTTVVVKRWINAEAPPSVPLMGDVMYVPSTLAPATTPQGDSGG